MRVLLDECCHSRLKAALAGHDVQTVRDLGWAGIKNGELLRRIEGRIDVFVTQDQNLPQQNPLAGRPYATIVVTTRHGLWSELEPLIKKLEAAIVRAMPGQIVRIA